MPVMRKVLGPARDEVQEALQSTEVQHYIISCGAHGAKRGNIIDHAGLNSKGAGAVRYSEWTLTRLWLKSLGYRSLSTHGWRWVHPHFFESIIPLMPMTNGVKFLNGNPRKSNLTMKEKARGTGHCNSWADREATPNPNPFEARQAKSDYHTEGAEPKDDEVLIPAHEREGGGVKVKAHTRKKRVRAEEVAKAMSEIIEHEASEVPAWVEAAAEVEGIEIIETESREIILRITVPNGVDVKVDVDERPTPPTGFEDFFTKPTLPHNIEKAAREQIKIRKGTLTAEQRARYARERKLLIGQKITQPGPYQGQVVLDHIVGSQYVIAFSMHGDGKEFVYHKKQTLDGSNITAEMSAGWREWVTVDE